ncbi:hypothetical protein [Kribbella sp. NPDC051620]|uniref:hypothetical protein n=1 Tax=Kribbella sp. NPDC051620 TaxID=3364120 RepID=UPI00379AFA9F
MPAPSRTIGHRVTTVTTYRRQTLAKYATRIFDQAAPGRLVLITCEDWNGKVYLSNAVAIAQRITRPNGLLPTTSARREQGLGRTIHSSNYLPWATFK